mmetsp:Transcript_22354/g.48921  ORF Transcript_22354/g.48921 Transcript_22354/m.48921 type:complete len:315 (-) Transcript_22354:37-981(-)
MASMMLFGLGPSSPRRPKSLEGKGRSRRSSSSKEAVGRKSRTSQLTCTAALRARSEFSAGRLEAWRANKVCLNSKTRPSFRHLRATFASRSTLDTSTAGDRRKSLREPSFSPFSSGSAASNVEPAIMPVAAVATCAKTPCNRFGSFTNLATADPTSRLLRRPLCVGYCRASAAKAADKGSAKEAARSVCRQSWGSWLRPASCRTMSAATSRMDRFLSAKDWSTSLQKTCGSLVLLLSSQLPSSSWMSLSSKMHLSNERRTFGETSEAALARTGSRVVAATSKLSPRISSKVVTALARTSASQSFQALSKRSSKL